MNTRLRMLMLAGLMAFGPAACDDTPTGLAGSDDGSVDLSVNADMELQVVGDDVLAEVVVEDMALSMGMSDAMGGPFGDARSCFRDARGLLRDGDEKGARARATECRTNLVQAMLEQRGDEALDELFGRVEILLERISEAGDEYERLGDLEVKLQELLDEAYALRDQGELVGAGERLVLALQITDRMRHRHRDFVRDPQTHARLALARASEAIHLADDLIEQPTLKQEVILFRATELRRRAQFAFEHGWFRRAVVQARRAEGLSLFAVLGGERPTVEDALSLLDLAEVKIAAAEIAIGDDPTPAQQALLSLAVRLKERGARAINTWHWRGTGLLWHSAVTSELLIPDAEGTDTA